MYSICNNNIKDKIPKHTKTKMNFNFKSTIPLFPHCKQQLTHLHQQRRRLFTSFIKRLHTARASPNAPNSSSSHQGNAFLLPGATVATLLMLGVLHARRLYDDKKIEEAREKGIEFEFHPDVKASFLRLLPLRSISRLWGFVTNVEYPVWLRPYVYKAWARAFHSNLEEAALPLDQYASLRHFFVRTLKEGSRPIDPDPQCLVSPVDGIVLRFGELKTGGMIEQVKGFSYSVSSLLGASSFVPKMTEGNVAEEIGEQENNHKESDKSWWKISLASPKVRKPVAACPLRGLFYCVIYLKPGDYRRIHSPVNWNIHTRRHFSGRLFPVNERATRTIRNLYVENERVVLEGQWQEGYMAMAAIGATNIGSIELFIEPELRTNRPKKKLLTSDPPDERAYGPEGVGLMLKKGDQLAAFNMGSTVVLVFQAPISKSDKDGSSEFRFCIDHGDKICVGEALGSWRNPK